MGRLGNERNIIEIEAIVGKDMRPGQEQNSWQNGGVDCRRCESAPKVDPSQVKSNALIYRHKRQFGWGHDRRR